MASRQASSALAHLPALLPLSPVAAWHVLPASHTGPPASLPAPPAALQVRAEQEALKRAGGEAASDDEEAPVLAKPVQVAAAQQVGGAG